MVLMKCPRCPAESSIRRAWDARVSQYGKALPAPFSPCAHSSPSPWAVPGSPRTHTAPLIQDGVTLPQRLLALPALQGSLRPSPPCGPQPLRSPPCQSRSPPLSSTLRGLHRPAWQSGTRSQAESEVSTGPTARTFLSISSLVTVQPPNTEALRSAQSRDWRGVEGQPSATHSAGAGAEFSHAHSHVLLFSTSTAYSQSEACAPFYFGYDSLCLYSCFQVAQL